MKITLCTLSPRRQVSGPAGELVRLYIERAAKYCDCAATSFRGEAELLEFCADTRARTRPLLLLADSRGAELTSEQFAAALGQYRDGGTQSLIFAIGPADGWTEAARRSAARTVAFGRITLPHELAAAVAAEQLYRALTILAGHPYHSGH